MTGLLPGFAEHRIVAGGTEIHARTAGSGPPLLLLHGYPQSLWMWHRVAPALADSFTVVLADLRGYGRSSAPPPDPSGAVYSKRAMAADQAALMTELGHDRFGVVGHDRGGRVAHRLALDHGDRVAALAVLDIVPTLHMFENVDLAMATSYFHWFFLTQPGGLPEQLIGADPDTWMRSRFEGRHAGPFPFDPEAMTEYLTAFRDPAVIAATCADYRAAATIDLEHDRESRGRQQMVTAPLLALWGSHSYVGRHFDVMDTWRNYAAAVDGAAIEADHYLAEEAPAATARQLGRFFRGQAW
jgi:haloacetate dehalogenase